MSYTLSMLKKKTIVDKELDKNTLIISICLIDSKIGVDIDALVCSDKRCIMSRPFPTMAYFISLLLSMV